MGRVALAILLGSTLMPLPLARPAAAADRAAPDFAEAVDLPRLRDHALANNPDIRAAEQRWRATQARPSQEGSLPDPMINTAYHNEGFDRFRQGSPGSAAWLRFGVEQEIPFPGKLSLRETAAEREADRIGALYRARVLRVLTRLRVAYNDYLLADQSIEIIRRNKELLEKLTEAAEARYEVGEGLQQDIARAYVELSILVGRLTSLAQERESAAAALNAIVNRPPAAPLGRPVPVEKQPLHYTLEELERVARERSPDLQAAGFDVARAETKLDLARREYWPDFVLRADYMNKSSLTPEWEVGAGIRVPLYFWRKQAFGVREAAAEASAARAGRQGTIQDVLERIRDLHARATSADRLVELYGNAVVPQAEVALSSAQAAYQVGTVDFLTLLNSFTVLNDYQVRYHEELAHFDTAVARLEEAAGLLPGETAEGGAP